MRIYWPLLSVFQALRLHPVEPHVVQDLPYGNMEMRYFKMPNG